VPSAAHILPEAMYGTEGYRQSGGVSKQRMETGFDIRILRLDDHGGYSVLCDVRLM
jgi:hypothetical protein